MFVDKEDTITTLSQKLEEDFYNFYEENKDTFKTITNGKSKLNFYNKDIKNDLNDHLKMVKTQTNTVIEKIIKKNTNSS